MAGSAGSARGGVEEGGGRAREGRCGKNERMDGLGRMRVMRVVGEVKD